LCSHLLLRHDELGAAMLSGLMDERRIKGERERNRPNNFGDTFASRARALLVDKPAARNHVRGVFQGLPASSPGSGRTEGIGMDGVRGGGGD
jgi:hypothetical protein